MSISPTNTQIKFVKTNKSSLQTQAVTNGNVYFVNDTKELFFDFDSTRVEVKDILILNTDAERTSILFSPLNKFYFCLDTQKLWLYKDGTWYEISGGNVTSEAIIAALGYTPVNPSSLSTVATSGSYADLTNKPTIPTITNTYSSTSTDGMSGKAVASAISAFQTTADNNYKVIFRDWTVT